MCNAFNGIAIVLCFRGISIVTGFSEAIWQVIITLAIIISTWYSAKEGANKQVISSQADSLIKISRIWADFFPANTSNQ
ncbi:hypothetical protein ACP8F9_24100, partial [Klebsiella pneumoniae]